MFGTLTTSQMSSQVVLAIALPITPVIIFLAILAFPAVFMVLVSILYYAFPSDAQKKAAEAKHKEEVRCRKCGAIIDSKQQMCQKCSGQV